MIPPTAHIMKKRYDNRRRLRMMSLIVMLVGLWFAIYPVIDKLFTGDIFSWRRYELGIFAASATFMVVALVLWFVEPWLSRLLVPIPQDRCPQCSYRLEQLTCATCPECGLALPPQLINARKESEE